LRARGHEVDDLDLYAEKFDPLLSRETLLHYVDVSKNRAEVVPYVERVLAADALVLVFPVWFDGLPAILQGFFERVFLPGVSFKIDENGLFHPMLWNIKRLAAVCTYGESRRHISLKGDPPRRFVRQNIGGVIAPKGRFEYIAHYDMNFTTPGQRARFLQRVTRAFRAW
jgi:putative NADPH-quinone reductase